MLPLPRQYLHSPYVSDIAQPNGCRDSQHNDRYQPKQQDLKRIVKIIHFVLHRFWIVDRHPHLCAKCGQFCYVWSGECEREKYDDRLKGRQKNPFYNLAPPEEPGAHNQQGKFNKDIAPAKIREPPADEAHRFRGHFFGHIHPVLF
jgi:hypothetical protein